MIADEAKEWIESLIGTLRADLSNQVRDVSDALHKRFDVAHDKHNTTLSALSHLIQKVHDMAVDHASILADLKTFDADLEAKVDAAVAEFQSFESTHAAAQESLSDIGAIVAGLPAKLAKLDAIKEPTDASTSSSASIDSVSGGASAPTATSSDSVSGASASTPVTATTTTASGASVETSVDAANGNTIAVKTDPATGVTSTTTVSHSDGSATTTDASGATVDTDHEAAQAATQAAAAQGVTVPAGF